MLIDAAVEYLCKRFFGLSLLSLYEYQLNVHCGLRFHALNLVLFSSEMLFVMFFYATLRPQFGSNTKPMVITICFFVLFVGFLVGQLVNAGVYPPQPAILFGISTLIAFPVSTCIGVSVYERIAFS